MRHAMAPTLAGGGASLSRLRLARFAPSPPPRQFRKHEDKSDEELEHMLRVARERFAKRGEKPEPKSATWKKLSAAVRKEMENNFKAALKAYNDVQDELEDIEEEVAIRKSPGDYEDSADDGDDGDDDEDDASDDEDSDDGSGDDEGGGGSGDAGSGSEEGDNGSGEDDGSSEEEEEEEDSDSDFEGGEEEDEDEDEGGGGSKKRRKPASAAAPAAKKPRTAKKKKKTYKRALPQLKPYPPGKDPKSKFFKATEGVTTTVKKVDKVWSDIGGIMVREMKRSDFVAAVDQKALYSTPAADEKDSSYTKEAIRRGGATMLKDVMHPTNGCVAALNNLTLTMKGMSSPYSEGDVSVLPAPVKGNLLDEGDIAKLVVDKKKRPEVRDALQAAAAASVIAMAEDAESKGVAHTKKIRDMHIRDHRTTAAQFDGEAPDLDSVKRKAAMPVHADEMPEGGNRGFLDLSCVPAEWVVTNSDASAGTVGRHEPGSLYWLDHAVATGMVNEKGNATMLHSNATKTEGLRLLFHIVQCTPEDAAAQLAWARAFVAAHPGYIATCPAEMAKRGPSPLWRWETEAVGGGPGRAHRHRPFTSKTGRDANLKQPKAAKQKGGKNQPKAAKEKGGDKQFGAKGAGGAAGGKKRARDANLKQPKWAKQKGGKNQPKAAKQKGGTAQVVNSLLRSVEALLEEDPTRDPKDLLHTCVRCGIAHARPPGAGPPRAGRHRSPTMLSDALGVACFWCYGTGALTDEAAARWQTLEDDGVLAESNEQQARVIAAVLDRYVQGSTE